MNENERASIKVLMLSIVGFVISLYGDSELYIRTLESGDIAVGEEDCPPECGPSRGAWEEVFARVDVDKAIDRFEAARQKLKLGGDFEAQALKAAGALKH